MTDLPILQPANEPDLDPLLNRLGSMAMAGNPVAAGSLTGLIKWLCSESSPLIQKVAVAMLAEAMERASPCTVHGVAACVRICKGKSND